MGDLKYKTWDKVSNDEILAYMGFMLLMGLVRIIQEFFQFVIGGGRLDKPENCLRRLYVEWKNKWIYG